MDYRWYYKVTLDEANQSFDKACEERDVLVEYIKHLKEQLLIVQSRLRNEDKDIRYLLPQGHEINPEDLEQKKVQKVEEVQQL